MRQSASDRQNLLLRSEEFGTAPWSAINCSVGANTPDTLDPVGTSTADEIKEDGAATYKRVQQVPSFAKDCVLTFSVYVKKGTRDWVSLQARSGIHAAYFNVSTGTAGSTAGSTVVPLSYGIEPAGNGWYRCWLAYRATPGDGGYLNAIYPASADGTTTYLGVLNAKALYVWGAQLEQDEAPGPYVQTVATAVGTNRRRRAAPAHNLFRHSDAFTNSAWAKTQCAAAATADTLDPYGGNNATKLTDTLDGLALSHYIYQVPVGMVQADAPRPVVCSFYAKAGTKSIVDVMDTNGGWGAYFDLANGTVSNITAGRTATIEAVGNGWYRCTVFHSYTYPVVGPLPTFGLVICNGAPGYTYQGDGTGTVYIYGAQFVRGTVAHQYLATTTQVFGLAGPRKAAGAGRSAAIMQQNLLLWSEQFNNGIWSKNDTSIAPDTAETLDPVGTSTADKVTDSLDIAPKAHNFYQTVTAVQNGKLFTWALYVKAGTARWFMLANADSTRGVFFDLQTGVLGSQVGGANGSMQAIGNGWYRCTMTCVSGAGSSGSYCIFYPATADGVVTYQGDGTRTWYVWGANVSLSNSGPPYVRTEGAAYNPGIPRNQTHLRQNLLRNSQVFASVWARTLITATDNDAVAPDGTPTAARLNDSNDAAPTQHYLGQTYTVANGNVYTFSVYLKQGTLTRAQLWGGSGASIYATFDLAAGTASGLVGCTAAVEAVDGGWYRCSITYTAPVGAMLHSFYIATANAAGNPVYQGAGTGTIYAWGAQVAMGPVPALYQPTGASAVNVMG